MMDEASLANEEGSDSRFPTETTPADANNPEVSKNSRTVVCGDAIEWLNSFEDNGLPEGYCGFTSLPDITELIRTFKTETAEYKQWFTDAVALFMSKLRVGSYVVFLQSDVRYLSTSGEVSEWIDKSYLCSAAAERTGCVMMWHKLVSTDKNSTKRSTGRPTYSHLVCYAKNGFVNRPVEVKASRNKRRKEIRAENMRVHAEKTAREEAAPEEGLSAEHTVEAVTEGVAHTTLIASTPEPTHVPEAAMEGHDSSAVQESGADVRSFLRCTYRTSLFAAPDMFYRGEMLWPKGIGLDCCFVGVTFLKSVAFAKGIIDPFAGQGTVLAMADAVGLPSIGVEISAKRCKKAHNLKIDLDLVSPYLRKLALDVVEERAVEAKNKHQPRKPTAGADGGGALAGEVATDNS